LAGGNVRGERLIERLSQTLPNISYRGSAVGDTVGMQKKQAEYIWSKWLSMPGIGGVHESPRSVSSEKTKGARRSKGEFGRP